MWLGACADLRHRTQTQHAFRARGQHQITQRLQRGQAVIGHHQHQAIAIFEFTDSRLRIISQQRQTQRLDTLPIGRHALWIELHLVFAGLPAEHLDLRNVRQRRQHRAQLIDGQITQADQVTRIGHQRQAQHRKHRRVHASHNKPRTCGQIDGRGVDRRLHLQFGHSHHRAPSEIYRHLGRSARTGRSQTADIGH